jgi:hypothetical protein
MQKVTSPAKIAANRANAAKSTGPVTPAGKAAVAKNTLKHGLLSTEIVLSLPGAPERRASFRDIPASCRRTRGRVRPPFGRKSNNHPASGS